MSELFFSYSHVDEEYRDQLERHLSLLKRNGAISTWHDRRIVAGEPLEGTISEAMERADIILLLVSPDFIASDYCFDIEMKRAMERHRAGEARVVPVIIRHCDWQSAPFGKLLGTPRDGKPVSAWSNKDEAFLDVVNSIKAALPIKGGVIQASSISADRSAPIKAVTRSSNLGISKKLSDIEINDFLEESFEYISQFFQHSLKELESRHAEISVRFARNGATEFSVKIYRHGDEVSTARILLGDRLGRGIYYSSNLDSSRNSWEENMTVQVVDNVAAFKGMMGMAFGRERTLSKEAAAEQLWARLMMPLQRD